VAESEYKVGQLAKASKTKAVTIRYYERQGLMRNPARNCSGYRIYNDDDLNRLLFIRRSRHLGFSVDSVRKLLDLSDKVDAPCADVDAKVSQHLTAVRERMAQLNTLESELERLSVCCQGEGVIRDCRIIEALSDASHVSA
jgi:DNA-binding transcriptional MerR regulator